MKTTTPRSHSQARHSGAGRNPALLNNNWTPALRRCDEIQFSSYDTRAGTHLQQALGRNPFETGLFKAIKQGVQEKVSGKSATSREEEDPSGARSPAPAGRGPAGQGREAAEIRQQRRPLVADQSEPAPTSSGTSA